jgi:hypothetical protein
MTCLVLAAMPLLQGGNEWVPGDPYFPSPASLSDSPTWIPLDAHGRENVGAKPSYEIEYASQGDEQRYRVLARVHGFWVEPHRNTDSEIDLSYLEVRVPGMGVTDAIGLPQLPLIRTALGIPGTTLDVELVSPDLRLFATFDNARILPHQGPDLEPVGGDGQALPFKIDENFYGNYPGSWPAGAGMASAGPDHIFATVPYTKTTLQMFKYEPAKNQLQVARELEFDLIFRSETAQPITLSRSWARAASQFLENYDWLLDKGFIHGPLRAWKGRYLIIHPKEWLAQLDPLIDLKQERGYAVDRITIESIGSADSEDFFDAIKEWYFDRPVLEEKYVLLVGDTSLVPHRQTSVTDQDGFLGSSDMRYSFLHSENTPSLWIGRLPAESASECLIMVDKSVAYQTEELFDHDFYETATLAAHPGEGDAYLDCIDVIMAQTHLYDRPRNFIDRGGDTSDGRDQHVISDIDDKHVGLVMYRGHGSTSAWSPWDFDGNRLNDADLSTLSNTTYNPVVFSVSCSNHGIQTNSDAIGREWMYYQAGASASVGAMHPSYRWQNNTFAEYAWIWLQSDSVNSIAATTMCALNSAALMHSDQWSRWNQQVYSVFGDPEMRVYNKAPFQIRIVFPGLDVLQPQLPLELDVLDDLGRFVPDAIVTLSGPQGPIFSGLSGPDGSFEIPAGLDLGDHDELTIRAWVDDRNGIDHAEVIAVDTGSSFPEDLNDDGLVNGADLAQLLASWGQSGAGDFDGSGAVDGADLSRLLAAWD